jgi:glycosyltransferase involved in cell wall biosynthesis
LKLKPRIKKDRGMADRKLLILTYHFPPSSAAGAHRLLGFVRHLPKFGWQCAVVAPPGLPWEPSDRALRERVPDDTAVYTAQYPSGLLTKPLRKAFPYAAWLPMAWAACRRALRDQRPDALLTSGPPHIIHLLGHHLRRRHGFSWVADFRDPWSAGGNSDIHGRVPAGWEAWAEKAVLRGADRIVGNTPRAKEILASAYPGEAPKMAAITNGYDPENFELASGRALPSESRTVDIIHPGEIYANRDPGPFLEAISKLDPAAIPDGRSLRVRFIGRLGPGAPQIEVLIRDFRLEGVATFSGQVSYVRSLDEMMRADILLLLDSSRRRAGVPAKLFEYVGAGRPILALAEPESDVAWVLRESGAPHRVAPPGDPTAIGRALTELLAETVGPPVREAGREPSPTRFTREMLAGELAGLLDGCVEGRKQEARAESVHRALAEAPPCT